MLRYGYREDLHPTAQDVARSQREPRGVLGQGSIGSRITQSHLTYSRHTFGGKESISLPYLYWTIRNGRLRSFTAPERALSMGCS